MHHPYIDEQSNSMPAIPQPLSTFAHGAELETEALSAALLTAAEALNYILRIESHPASASEFSAPKVVHDKFHPRPEFEIEKTRKNLDSLRSTDLQAMKVLHGLEAQATNHELATEIMEVQKRSMRAFYELPWDASERELEKVVRIAKRKAEHARTRTIGDKRDSELWMRAKYGLPLRAPEHELSEAIKLSALRSERARYKLPDHATEEDVHKVLSFRQEQASQYHRPNRLSAEI